MKIAVLGSNSFSGQDFICRALDEPGAEVIGIHRTIKHPMFLGYLEHPNRERLRTITCDIRGTTILDILDEERPTHIVNFAAQSEVAPSWESPADWYDTNVTALARIVNHLRSRDYLKRWLQISTPEVYGSTNGNIHESEAHKPSTPYAASRAAGDVLLDLYAGQYGFPMVRVRSANVCGARQQLHKLIPKAIVAIKSGQRVPVHGNGSAKRSWIHIHDVSRGEQAALTRGALGHTYHLATLQQHTVTNVVAAIAAQMGARFSAVTHSVPVRRGHDAMYGLEPTKAMRDLGWYPHHTLEDVIRETIAWVESNWSEIQHMPTEYRHAA